MIKGIYLTTIVLLSVCTTSGYNIDNHINYWKSGCLKIKKNDESCSLKIYTDTTKQKLEYQIDGYSKQELATKSGENLYASLNVMSELSELAWSLSRKGKTPENIISLLKNKTSFSAAQKNGIGLLCLMVEYFNRMIKLIKDIYEEDGFFISAQLIKDELDFDYIKVELYRIWLQLNDTYDKKDKNVLNLLHDLEFYWDIFGGSYWCASKFADEMKKSENNFEKVASMRIKRMHFTECIQDSFFLREAISLAREKKTFSTEIKKQVISIKEAETCDGNIIDAFSQLKEKIENKFASIINKEKKFCKRLPKQAIVDKQKIADKISLVIGIFSFMEWLNKNINNCYYTKLCESVLGLDKATVDDKNSFLQKEEICKMLEMKPEILTPIAKEKKGNLASLYDLLVKIIRLRSSGRSNPEKYKGSEYQKLQNDILENINKIVN